MNTKPQETIRSGGHIDHMLHQTRAHHVQLSAMADMKANILLTMSSVALTVSLRYVTNPVLKTGAFIFIAFALLTIVLAAYVVMPHLKFQFDTQLRPDTKSHAFNFLFFGDFSKLDYSEYRDSMMNLIASSDQTYEMQIREVYLLGVFLSRTKYRYLRLAYASFIVGTFTSVVVICVNAFLL